MATSYYSPTYPNSNSLPLPVSKHDGISLSKPSLCYIPPTEYSSISDLPSATATAVVEFDDYSSPMFIEADHIICCEDFDPFLGSGIDLVETETLAQADVVHEVTAAEIPTYDSDLTVWHECYDAVVVKKENYDFDCGDDLKSSPECWHTDEILFAEIIDDLAISGFEEEKNDSILPTTTTVPTSTPKNLNNASAATTTTTTPYYLSSSIFDNMPLIEQQEQDHHSSIIASEQSYYSSDDLSDPDFFLDDFSLDEQMMTFSIGGPKPNASSISQEIPANRHLSQTTKLRSLLPSQSSSSSSFSSIPSPKFPPKPIREREQSQQKWKDKRTEKLTEGRMLDARQIATAKRERSNGKFSKRKINWVSITEVV